MRRSERISIWLSNLQFTASAVKQRKEEIFSTPSWCELIVVGSFTIYIEEKEPNVP